MTLTQVTAGGVTRATALRGDLRLPSDKSVAHRALIANALALVDGGASAEEHVVITVRAAGDDVRSTVRCLRSLGFTVDDVRDRTGDRWTEITLEGSFDRGVASPGGRVPATSARLTAPAGTLDCGNSGTTMRLLAGLLAGRPLRATLDGDRSLRRRPMGRLADRLRAMGATIDTTDGRAPIRIVGRRDLRALEHDLPVASAQLLGAICLAALSAGGETRVLVPGPTRDHTERLLAWMGVPIERHGPADAGRDSQLDGHRTVTTIRGPARPRPRSLTVPGDPSAATPWLIAAAIHPNAELRLVGVGLNPTRLEAVEVLREMGADIEVVPADHDEGPEPVGDLVVRSAGRLRAVRLGGHRVAALIDELPALAVAMAAAEGTSELRDAGELRGKESDRIAAVVAGLAAIGARVEELPDGWRVSAGTPRDAAIVTHGDHRIAIAFAVAALSGASGSVRLDNPACVAVSYPTFWADVAQATADAGGVPEAGTTASGATR